MKLQVSQHSILASTVAAASIYVIRCTYMKSDAWSANTMAPTYLYFVGLSRSEADELSQLTTCSGSVTMKTLFVLLSPLYRCSFSTHFSINVTRARWWLYCVQFVSNMGKLKCPNLSCQVWRRCCTLWRMAITGSSFGKSCTFLWNLYSVGSDSMRVTTRLVPTVCATSVSRQT